MCDYSLDFVASRPAKVGDKLVTTKFKNSVTRGFAAVEEPTVAVCVLPGTEVAFERKSSTAIHSSEPEDREKVSSVPADQHGAGDCAPRRVGVSRRKDHVCSPGCAKASTRPCCSCRLLRAPRTKRSSRSTVLSLPDRAARYRACLAVGAIEKSHRGADGSSTTRARQQNRIAEGGTLALWIIRSKGTPAETAGPQGEGSCARLVCPAG